MCRTCLEVFQIEQEERRRLAELVRGSIHQWDLPQQLNAQYR